MPAIRIPPRSPSPRPRPRKADQRRRERPSASDLKPADGKPAPTGRDSPSAHRRRAPKLTLTYGGTAPRAATHVLAQIIDDATGKVLGNQITPIPVNLNGRTHTVTEPLEIIAASASPGGHFTLQIVAQSTAYNVHPLGGSVSFSRIQVRLPGVR